MLEDTIPFELVQKATNPSGIGSRGVQALINFLEKTFGARFVYKKNAVPFNKPELLDLCIIAEKLKKAGVIDYYYKMKRPSDEPPLYAWSAKIASTRGTEHSGSGGSASSERLALTATLAEAVERHIWFEKTDYFTSPTVGTASKLAQKGSILDPERFAGFSETQRKQIGSLRLSPNSEYLWIRGHSWVSGKSVWVPAQAVSGDRELREERKKAGEPFILSHSTNGLATGQGREQAVLSGALELIERDAYVVMWLNQLTLPQLDLQALCAQNNTLADLIEKTKQYRLNVSAVRMLTDAPTYAVCVVVEDTTGNVPKVMIGMRADKNLAYATEKALLEALRIRITARSMQERPPEDWSPAKKALDIGHMDRLLYWMTDNRSERLRFLTQGPVQHFAEPWEQDSDVEHLERIVGWARAKGYEFASVAMTHAKSNVTPWHIEKVIVPELQQIYLHERTRNLGGKRLSEIPTLFGYTARAEPYLDDPHPFA